MIEEERLPLLRWAAQNQFMFMLIYEMGDGALIRDSVIPTDRDLDLDAASLEFISLATKEPLQVARDQVDEFDIHPLPAEMSNLVVALARQTVDELHRALEEHADVSLDDTERTELAVRMMHMYLSRIETALGDVFGPDLMFPLSGHHQYAAGEALLRAASDNGDQVSREKGIQFLQDFMKDHNEMMQRIGKMLQDAGSVENERERVMHFFVHENPDNPKLEKLPSDSVQNLFEQGMQALDLANYIKELQTPEEMEE